MMAQRAEDWLHVTEAGLYCEPGGFHIDPSRAVDRALVTHGHADHARPGSAHVLATAETIAVMQVRYGEAAGHRLQAVPYGEAMQINGVGVRFVPAGHVLGSAQVVLEWNGTRVVASGDYKRDADPTCAPFEAVPCDVFITEATFGLPVFRMGNPADEIAKLFASMETFPDRTHVIGAYGLGKAQRMIRLVRDAGYEHPIWLHGALIGLCELYEDLGVALGDLRPATGADKANLKGALVVAPPSAARDKWSRRLTDPVNAFASGWMRVRGRARQGGVELPLVISDHADWNDLTDTIEETGAGEVWVTHGREEALVHWCMTRGLRGRALALIGREDDDG